MNGKTPWEEEWRTCPIDSREVECVDESSPDDPYRIAEVYMGTGHGHSARTERARLISAAPDMARALLGVRRLDVADYCWCDYAHDQRFGHDQSCKNARAALKKGGVIP